MEKIIIDKTRCDLCGTCISVCPPSALSFAGEEELVVNNDICIFCLRCIKVCPVAALSKEFVADER